MNFTPRWGSEMKHIVSQECFACISPFVLQSLLAADPSGIATLHFEIQPRQQPFLLFRTFLLLFLRETITVQGGNLLSSATIYGVNKSEEEGLAE